MDDRFEDRLITCTAATLHYNNAPTYSWAINSICVQVFDVGGDVGKVPYIIMVYENTLIEWHYLISTFTQKKNKTFCDKIMEETERMFSSGTTMVTLDTNEVFVRLRYFRDIGDLL